MKDEKLFTGLDSFFDDMLLRQRLVLSLLSPCQVQRITLIVACSAIMSEITASSNYPIVQQPHSLCC